MRVSRGDVASQGLRPGSGQVQPLLQPDPALNYSVLFRARQSTPDRVQWRLVLRQKHWEEGRRVPPELCVLRGDTGTLLFDACAIQHYLAFPA